MPDSLPEAVGVAAPPPVWDVETDVAIIGAGACGLVAALRAAASGADVVVLERDASPAGSTALSSGFIPAPGTLAQQRLGIEDSPARLSADIQAKAKGSAHPGITATATREIAAAMDWLEQSCGLEWVVLDDFLYPGHSRHRMHTVPEKSGAALMTRLQAASADRQIPIVTEARATILHRDAEKICGVSVDRPDGRSERVRARAVILACNGYGGNPDLVAEHIPEIAGALYFGHAGNTGDALRWGAALGAGTRDLSAYQGHGSVVHPHGILCTWALMMEGGIQVNAAGTRFSNEHDGYSEQATRVLAQPGGIAWNIYDDRLHDLGMGFPDYRAAVEAGAVRHGALEQIATGTGLPLDALRRTMADTHAFQRGAEDPFGRDFTGQPPLGPGLCALQVTGALFHTQGGLEIDAQTRVLRPDGIPLAGLYAGGGAACGVSGASVEGYLSGNGLLTAVALGFVAGHAAAGIAVRGPR